MFEQSGTDEGTTTKGRKVRGRKNADNQEAVTRPQLVSEKIDELVLLYTTAQACSADFGDAVKAAAEASGYNAAAIRKFVVARAGENFQERKRELEQQMELFSEVGE